jgi:hypothetical protein
MATAHANHCADLKDVGKEGIEWMNQYINGLQLS